MLPSGNTLRSENVSYFIAGHQVLVSVATEMLYFPTSPHLVEVSIVTVGSDKQGHTL